MRRKFLPLVAVGLLTAAVTATVIGYYWLTLTNIPFIVSEPLELIEYPTAIDMYAGETKAFIIRIRNHAQASLNVEMVFSLNDTEYQERYVTFSGGPYLVNPGDNTFNFWVTVDPTAPPKTLNLTIELLRYAA